MHPGTYLKDYISSLNIKASAEELGVSRSTFHNMLAGKAALSIDLALRIEKVWGFEAQYLLKMQVDNDLEKAEALLNEMKRTGTLAKVGWPEEWVK